MNILHHLDYINILLKLSFIFFNLYLINTNTLQFFNILKLYMINNKK